MKESLSQPKGKVIIVDDDHLVSNFTKHTIEYGINQEVVTFDNGFLAWQHLQENHGKIDVVIADVNIPEMDGLELLARSKAEQTATSFILTTSNPAHEPTARELGADAFLLKPFEFKDLFFLVKEFLIASELTASDKIAVFPNKEEKPLLVHDDPL